MNPARLIGAIFLFFLSGLIILKSIDRDDKAGLGTIPRLGVAFMLGLGMVSLQMFFMSLLEIRFAPAVIMFPWILAAAVFFLPGAKSCASGQKTGFKAIDLIPSVLILFQAGYAFAYALTVPLSAWDAWFIWFFKAKAFFADRGVTSAFLTDPNFSHDHPDYPLLVPLSVAWVYTSIGAAVERAGKVLYPLQLVSILTIVYYCVRRLFGHSEGLIFAALLTLTPIVLMHSAGFPRGQWMDYTGYADLTLAIYFLSAGAFIYLFAIEGSPVFITLSSLMLGLGAWTKNEGVTFAVFGAVLLVLFMLSSGRRGVKDFAFLLVPLLIFILPWAAYKSVYALKSEYVANISAFSGNISRLTVVIPAFLKFMFLKVNMVNMAWWAYLISSLVNIKALFRKKVYIFHLLLFLQMGTYVFVYIITPVDLNWHLSTSLDRLVLHMLPLSFLAAAVNICMLMNDRKEAVRESA